MRIQERLQKLKPWMLPLAMVFGVVCHNYMEAIAFVAPYLIFVMLLITFCKVKPSEFRVTALSKWLILVQIVGALGVYFACLPMGREVAEGAFICVFCPTATAAPVITGMLGGSIPRLATFSIISNVAVAIGAPVIFTLMGTEANFTFPESVTMIATRVVPLIVLPLFTALAMMKTMPKVHKAIATRQGLSFYIWAVSLFIVVGRAVSFIMSEPSDRIPEMCLLAGLSLAVCCGQFFVGRKVGARCGDKIAGAQGLGQKNTVLAIWMALTYLHPISSVAPAAYVAWQNIINSTQLWLKARRESEPKG